MTETMTRQQYHHAIAKAEKEADIHAYVVDTWRRRGLPDTLVATIPNMRAHGQAGLTPGLPDLVVFAKGGVTFIELKTIKGRLSAAQQDLRSLCNRLGIPFFVTYGRDEPVRLLEELGVVRRAAA